MNRLNGYPWENAFRSNPEPVQRVPSPDENATIARLEDENLRLRKDLLEAHKQHRTTLNGIYDLVNPDADERVENEQADQNEPQPNRPVEWTDALGGES